MASKSCWHSRSRRRECLLPIDGSSVLLALWVLCTIGISRTHAAGQEPADAAVADDPASSAIRFYQRYLSSLRHVRCRFTPSCSEYAAQVIATYGLAEGSARAADRLMRCNASAPGAYARDARGLLEDPADETGAAVTSLRVPRWLLPASPPKDPPLAGALAPAWRSRLSETLSFARVLERRGDCESASLEYQRAGLLADTVAADAWAFARAGSCHFAASQWAMAERAYLSSALLSAGERRATAVYAAAASRFNAGSFAACERLLSDPSLAALSSSGEASQAPTVAEASASSQVATDPRAATEPRVAALSGLCAFAGGHWSRAQGHLSRAAAGGDTVVAKRSLRLSEFAGKGPDLPRRSPGWAAALSAILPGAGQVYSGRAQDGLRHLLFNGALIYSVVSLARGDNVPAALIVGGVALPFYVGNILGARAAARRFDRLQRLDLLERALAESSR